MPIRRLMAAATIIVALVTPAGCEANQVHITAASGSVSPPGGSHPSASPGESAASNTSKLMANFVLGPYRPRITRRPGLQSGVAMILFKAGPAVSALSQLPSGREP
jgi:hypothetical protein